MKPSTGVECTITVVSRLPDSAAHGTFENLWRHFWLSQWGGAFYWHLVTRKIPNILQYTCGHPTMPTIKNYLAPNVTKAEDKKSYTLSRKTLTLSYVKFIRAWWAIRYKSFISILQMEKLKPTEVTYLPSPLESSCLIISFSFYGQLHKLHGWHELWGLHKGPKGDTSFI